MNLNDKRIVWIFLLLLSVVGFYSLIPLEIYNKAAVFISIVGGVSFVFFLAKSLDFLNKQLNLNLKKAYLILVIFSGLIMLLVYREHFNSQKKEFLKQDGLITYAIVMNGSRHPSGGEASYHLMSINFIDHKKNKRNALEWGSGREFNSIALGDTIYIVFSKSNPEIVNLLSPIPFGDNDSHTDDIELEDLVHLLSFKDSLDTKSKEYLDSVALSNWIIEYTDSVFVIKSVMEDRSICYSSVPSTIIYKYPFEQSRGKDIFEKQMINLNLMKSVRNNITCYENDSLYIETQIVNGVPNDDRYRNYVLNLVKKKSSK